MSVRLFALGWSTPVSHAIKRTLKQFVEENFDMCALLK